MQSIWVTLSWEQVKYNWSHSWSFFRSLNDQLTLSESWRNLAYSAFGNSGLDKPEDNSRPTTDDKVDGMLLRSSHGRGLTQSTGLILNGSPDIILANSYWEISLCWVVWQHHCCIHYFSSYITFKIWILKLPHRHVSNLSVSQACLHVAPG